MAPNSENRPLKIGDVQRRPASTFCMESGDQLFNPILSHVYVMRSQGGVLIDFDREKMS